MLQLSLSMLRFHIFLQTFTLQEQALLCGWAELRLCALTHQPGSESRDGCSQDDVPGVWMDAAICREAAGSKAVESGNY